MVSTMDFETLLWSILIGLAWLAATRGPETGADSVADQDDEERRLWHGADLRNRIDRGG